MIDGVDRPYLAPLGPIKHLFGKPSSWQLSLKLGKVLYGPDRAYIQPTGHGGDFFDKSTFVGFNSYAQGVLDGADRPYLSPLGPTERFFWGNRTSNGLSLKRENALWARLKLNTPDRSCETPSWEIDVRPIQLLNSKSARRAWSAVFSPTRAHRALFVGNRSSSGLFLKREKSLNGPGMWKDKVDLAPNRIFGNRRSVDLPRKLKKR